MYRHICVDSYIVKVKKQIPFIKTNAQITYIYRTHLVARLFSTPKLSNTSSFIKITHP